MVSCVVYGAYSVPAHITVPSPRAVFSGAEEFPPWAPCFPFPPRRPPPCPSTRREAFLFSFAYRGRRKRRPTRVVQRHTYMHACGTKNERVSNVGKVPSFDLVVTPFEKTKPSAPYVDVIQSLLLLSHRRYLLVYYGSYCAKLAGKIKIFATRVRSSSSSDVRLLDQETIFHEIDKKQKTKNKNST